MSKNGKLKQALDESKCDAASTGKATSSVIRDFVHRAAKFGKRGNMGRTRDLAMRKDKPRD